MTHPRFPGPDSSLCVFWHDFERLDDTGLLWYDQGPNKLHATPQAGFAAPNYGLGRTARGKGYANFTGAANVYATLPLRFYDVAPTTNQTLVAVARYSAQTINNRLFNARNGATGSMYYFVTTERMNLLAYDAGGAGTQSTDPADVPFSNRTHVSVFAHDKVRGLGANWHDGVQSTTTWAGNTNPISYDRTLVPSIGSAGAASYLVAFSFALILYRDYIPSHAEAVSITRYWRDKV